MNKEEVLKLAQLARVEISDEEAESLTHEFEVILDYVSEVKKAPTTTKEHPNKLENVGVFNVMREDSEPHESGLHTEELLSQAPVREGDYVKVKQILA